MSIQILRKIYRHALSSRPQYFPRHRSVSLPFLLMLCITPAARIEELIVLKPYPNHLEVEDPMMKRESQRIP